MGTPPLSQRYQNMPAYPPREIEKMAAGLGKDVSKCFRLHLGDTHYSEMHPLMKEAYIKAIEENRVHYTPSLGIPQLRERIAKDYQEKYGVNIDSEQVVIDMGSTLGISMTCSMVLNPGDCAIVINPAYPAYLGSIVNASGQYIQIPTKLKDGFKITGLDIEEVVDRELKKKNIKGDKVKLLIFNDPNNPTGQYESIEHKLKLASYADARNILIASDEAYIDTVFDGNGKEENGGASSFLEVVGPENAVILGTFSKKFAATGLRIAYRIIPKKYMEGVRKAQPQVILSTAEPNQYAALAAFDIGQEWFDKNLRTLKEHRDLVLKYFNETKFKIPDNLIARSGLYQTVPMNNIALKDGTRAGSNDVSWMALKKKDVLVTSGRGFGVDAENDFMRISLCLPRKELEEGVKRFIELLDEKYMLLEA